ncbi:MAG: acyl-CoA synthetase FdrA [Spirochaetaceae bacterium]|nr:MAG: acyl-CoA synthetase FdrA [Spirochaetaceae bacterium]
MRGFRSTHFSVQVVDNLYADSVFLMRVNAEVAQMPGVRKALVAMATDANLLLAKMIGFVPPQGVLPDQLLILAQHDGTQSDEALRDSVVELIRRRETSFENDVSSPRSIAAARELNPDATLAVVSVSGQYAAAEAEQALREGLSVMLFSDNVSVEDEVRLKVMAAEKGLLVMGPDCGSAIIHGTPICFANAVRRGPIGIIAASGTGLQEVSCLIHRYGSGVSHAIGTGGRDLKETSIGGRSVSAAMAVLENDPDTRVIVVISKPPTDGLMSALNEMLGKSSKPIVLHFVGRRQTGGAAGVYEALSLDDAARHASVLAGSAATIDLPGIAVPSAPSNRMKTIRGLYTGGTLADEAEALLGAGGIAVSRSADRLMSEHCIVDLGDDKFTRGRAHPMIDPTARCAWITTAAADDSVMLLDFVLGFGAHPDPVGATLPAIKNAFQKARNITLVAVVVGTDLDPQGHHDSCHRLEEAGVIVAASNAEAVILAASHAGVPNLGHAVSSAWTVPGPKIPPIRNDDADGTTPAAVPSAQREGASIALFSKPLSVIAVGVPSFAEDLKGHGIPIESVEWRPPARGNARLAALLNRVR